MDCPKTRIRDEILNTKGIHMNAKDVQNLAQKLKSKSDDDLHEAVEVLKTAYRKFYIKKCYSNKKIYCRSIRNYHFKKERTKLEIIKSSLIF